VCPSYLDGDQAYESPRREAEAVRTPGDTRLLASCAVFKVRGGASTPARAPRLLERAGAGAGLSKLNSMRAAPPAPSHDGGSARRATSAGPIDISVAGGRRPRPQTTGIGGVPGSRYASTGAVQPLQVLELP
jgi:hypothetical protein